MKYILFFTVLHFIMIIGCSSEKEIYQYHHTFNEQRWYATDSIVIIFTPKQDYDSAYIDFELEYFDDYEFKVLYLFFRLVGEVGEERLISFDIDMQNDVTLAEKNGIPKLRKFNFVIVKHFTFLRDKSYKFIISHCMPFAYVDRIHSLQISVFSH